MTGPEHPFFARHYDDIDVYYTAADERIAQVSLFDIDTCRRALTLPDLQSTARGAITRRLRRLERAVGGE